MKTVTLTVLVSDDAHSALTDGLGDVCRDGIASGDVLGFNFTGGIPADHVVGFNDVRITTPREDRP